MGSEEAFSNAAYARVDPLSAERRSTTLSKPATETCDTGCRADPWGSELQALSGIRTEGLFLTGEGSHLTSGALLAAVQTLAAARARVRAAMVPVRAIIRSLRLISRSRRRLLGKALRSLDYY